MKPRDTYADTHTHTPHTHTHNSVLGLDLKPLHTLNAPTTLMWGRLYAGDGFRTEMFVLQPRLWQRPVLPQAKKAQ